MPWVEFTEDFDFHIPEKRSTIAYKAGGRHSVTSECRDKAVSLGRARNIRTPNRDEAPDDPIIGTSEGPDQPVTDQVTETPEQ